VQSTGDTCAWRKQNNTQHSAVRSSCVHP
jgi:hypothetical protein